MRSNLTKVRMAIIQKSISNQCQRVCGVKGTLMVGKGNLIGGSVKGYRYCEEDYKASL